MMSKPEKSSSARSASSAKHGAKHDDTKLRYDLLDLDYEEGLAAAMTYGANKYGARNWEKGLKVSRLYAAQRRHVKAFMSGEDLDVESGLHHLFHANACLMMIYSLTSNPLWDDRKELKRVRTL